MPLTRIELSRLEACSSEPIRTPGTIQPHGALLAVDRESRRIVVASENTSDVLGYAPDHVLGRAVEDLLGEAVLPGLKDAAEGANLSSVEANGRPYDAIVHRDGPLTFVEFEPSMDSDATAASHLVAHRLSRITDRHELLATTTAEFARLTGFDRIMVYHFHPDGHGEVVAETHAEGMEPYEGLHFPASDIPDQARALYLTKLSRGIVSTVKAPVPLLGLAGTSAADLDLTHAELRSVSPFHLQFMRNMGQASTVSFSLVYRGALIGMITCAHRVERRLPFLTRRSLEVLAGQVALQLGAMAEVGALTHRVRSQDQRARLLGKIVASDDIAGALLDGEFTLLDVVAADAAIVRLDGVVSRTPNAPTGADELLSRDLTTNWLDTDEPELAPLVAPFAGALIRSIGDRGDFIALLRDEVVQSVDWLGDLTDQNRQERLSPRLSFSAWTQSVTGKSLPWGDTADQASLLASDVESALHRRDESRLATLAMHDPLTGLGNRRSLMDALDHATTASLALLFIDLDDFKTINDTHGHEAGDAVIVETGRRLLEHTRADDRVARLGGDEFVVMCAHTTVEDARALALRIADALQQPVGDYRVTASIGIVASAPETSPDDLLARADAAMYRAKQAGRNGVSL